MNNLFPKDFSKQTTIETTTTTTDEIQTLTQFQVPQFRKIEGEDDAIRRAYLAVISSSSSPSSPSPSPYTSRGQVQENLTRDDNHRLETTRKTSAFTRFIRSANYYYYASNNNNMLKRSMTFYKNLYMMNNNIRQEQQMMIQVNRRSMSTQVHHMISERRRREKINESFQHLRSLLPPGTKKDKASVLASTTEYLSSLKDRAEELPKRNEILETQLLTMKEASQFQQNGSERLGVYIRNIEERRIVDLQVIARENCSILDLVICLMEYLKMANYVNLVSVDANTTMVQSCPVVVITLRLRIQGDDEWDESTFLEAIKRVVEDMT